MTGAPTVLQSTMLEALNQKHGPIEKLRQRIHYIDAAEASATLQRDCAPRLCKRGDVDRVTNALALFTASAAANATVDALAFLAVRAPKAPTSLSIEVIGSFQRGDSAASETVRALIEADALMARRLANIIPVGLRFVSSNNVGPADFWNELFARWLKDRDQRLLTLLAFRRD